MTLETVASLHLGCFSNSAIPDEKDAIEETEIGARCYKCELLLLPVWENKLRLVVE